MQKEFSISNNKVIINFTAKYCDTSEKLLNSDGFRRVLAVFIKKGRHRSSNDYKYIEQTIIEDDENKIVDDITEILKLLLIFKREEIIKINPKYESFLSKRDNIVKIIENIYGFWRRLERYTVVHNSKINEGLENVSFVDANLQFSQLIINTYRKIEENILGEKPKVYRQLPAGANAGLIVNSIKWKYPEGYECLNGVPVIDSVLIDPPFISYPQKIKRDGFFTEVFENPLNCRINRDHWFCFPVKIGTLLAFIYFHRDFMAHGITLCNLFEIAKGSEYKDRKPDIVFVFGARDNAEKTRTIFYDDKKNDIMLGYINYSVDVDYFGYMKKMALTLHNLIMIKRGYLPIHGAMVNIVTKDGNTVNAVIMGDSGAGKSESLEAFRELGEEYISDMTVIFDDMGVVKPNGTGGKPMGYGTEIGAFVRLDDLDPGYAFREMDRSIFMNPDKTNARLVIPVASYSDITRGYPIDLFLYANNYDPDGEELSFFKSAKEAIPVFRSGARMAKGTTTEKGLVNTFFANPFGPVQREKETDKLITKYFNKFFETGIKVGQIRTRLGVKGKEKEGPKNAAIKLLDVVKKM
ncbi:MULTISPECIES: phosphoenolpyruvate carboxykinase [Clostridium]|uniref:phosphoenolpyruvate carboxykinase n=1 Tax=Clostridium TaxID=1485 RepID=UPI000826687C|nr:MULTISPECIES: phosphoenolpyruvate carboxykinase [Clostridium]PJI07344.1 phosphoenolpyruvate carboxykinase [Clostridium sp. CT7]